MRWWASDGRIEALPPVGGHSAGSDSHDVDDDDCSHFHSPTRRRPYPHNHPLLSHLKRCRWSAERELFYQKGNDSRELVIAIKWPDCLSLSWITLVIIVPGGVKFPSELSQFPVSGPFRLTAIHLECCWHRISDESFACGFVKLVRFSRCSPKDEGIPQVSNDIERFKGGRMMSESKLLRCPKLKLH